MYGLYVGIIIYVYGYCSRHTAYNTGFKLSFLEYLAELFPECPERKVYSKDILLRNYEHRQNCLLLTGLVNQSA